MKIQTNFSLKNYNTFGIEAVAKEFISITSVNELIAILQLYKGKPLFILGGGSNMLLTKDIEALVIHIDIKGSQILSETDDSVVIEVNAGENWHEFVLSTIKQDFGGLENMSLIPGNVGTTPVQNIGAYGVEIKDKMLSCKAININSLEIVTFSNSQCEFDYRESVFKSKYKGDYIIVSVTFQLTKGVHNIDTHYGDIMSQLAEKNIINPTIKDVSDAVIAIRQRKLPDPKVLGNSGSFFKNPIISAEHFAMVKEKHPEIRFFELPNGMIKVPAGWLIEQAGLKGYRLGDAGVHKNQALVLVNYGNATGNEILQLSQFVQKKIKELFDIEILAEVNVI